MEAVEVGRTPVFLIALFVLGIVLAVALLVAILSSERARRLFLGTFAVLLPLVLILVVLVVPYLFLAREEPVPPRPAASSSISMSGTRHAPRELAPEVRTATDAGDDAMRSSEPRVIRVPAAEPDSARDGARLFEVPDDLAAWERESVLDFRPEGPTPSWVANPGSSERTLETAGDTDFLYWRPNSSNNLVAYGGKELSRNDAEQAAQAIAAEKLAALALLRLKRAHRDLDVAEAARFARRAATGTDRLIERGMYCEKGRSAYAGADLYRCAVRVLADEPHIEALAAQIEDAVRAGALERQELQRRVFWMVVGVLLAGFAVFLIYAFLNASTRGQFAWPLRLASAAMFAAVCAAAYYLRSSFG